MPMFRLNWPLTSGPLAVGATAKRLQSSRFRFAPRASLLNFAVAVQPSNGDERSKRRFRSFTISSAVTAG
jgi:hypothetical protein